MERGGEIDGGGEDAGGVAGLDGAGGGLGKMQARQAVGRRGARAVPWSREGAAGGRGRGVAWGRTFMVAA